MEELWSTITAILTQDSLIFCLFVISFATTYVLTPPKKSMPAFLLRVLAVAIGMMMLSVVNSLSISTLQLPPFLFILCEFFRNLTTVIVYAVLFCKFPRAIKSAMSGSVLAVVCICTNLSHSLGYMVDAAVEGLTLPLLILIYGLILFFALFVTRFSIREVSDFPRFGAVLIITTNSLAIFITLTTQILDTIVIQIPGIYSVVVYSVLLVLEFVCYLSLYFICKERNEAEKYRVESQMLRAGADQLAMSNATLADLRRIRHDLKNSYAYMSTLLSQGRYDELAKVLDSFSPSKVNPEHYVDCGNSDISAIMTAEAHKALLHGFHIQHTLMVPPVLPFESGELFSLLSNLIDNAIDSNVRYGLTDDITVQISLREEYLYICVTNKLPPDADTEALLELKTSKEHPEEHGLGLQIVRRLAEKYNGYFLADIAEGRFIAEVLIDMMYQKGANAK